MPDAIFSIPETIIIPPTCQERFVPLGHTCAAPLRRLGLTFAGRSILHPPYLISRPSPAYHLLMLTRSGTARLETPLGSMEATAGRAWLAPARLPHRYQPTTDTWETLWFCLADQPRWTRLADGPARLFTPRAMDAIDRATTVFLDEALPGVQPRTVATAAAELVATLLERCLDELIGADEHSEARAGLDALWRRVDADLQRPWTVALLAREFGVSAPHLQRLVRQHQGESPMAVVTRLRLQRTSELLRGSGYTLDRIASLVGYSTPFALSRTFLREQGVRPSTCRDS